MRVRDLRIRLKELIDGTPAGVAEPEFSKLLEILADLDDMSIEAFFRRLRGKTKMPPPPATPTLDVAEVVARLNEAFHDDETFEKELNRLRTQKAITKPILTKIFYDVFNRTRGVPKKATRDELLRLIADERNIVVRNEKMGKMLGRRVIPAE